MNILIQFLPGGLFFKNVCLSLSSSTIVVSVLIKTKNVANYSTPRSASSSRWARLQLGVGSVLVVLV